MTAGFGENPQQLMLMMLEAGEKRGGSGVNARRTLMMLPALGNTPS